MTVLWLAGWVHDLIQAATAPRYRPRPRTAWTGPWPSGCLPVSLVLGEYEPEFVGYLAVPAGGDPDLVGFLRLHADALERARERRAG